MRLLRVDETDTPTGSRVGGRPPRRVDRTCPVCGGAAEYVLTLAPDLLGPTVDDRVLSLLACADVGCRFAGPTGACSTLVVAHRDAGRADEPEPEDAFPGRALVAGPPSDVDPDPNSDQSKVGGAPGFLQSWGFEAGPALEAEGLTFLAQWSEVSYRPDMDGAYPFLWGTVYLYAATTADGHVDLGTVRGFWQNA